MAESPVVATTTRLPLRLTGGHQALVLKNGVRIPEGQPDFAAAIETAVCLHIYRNIGPQAAIRWKLFKMVIASGMTFNQIARRIHKRPGTVAKWLRDGDRSINKLDPISDLALACGCEMSFSVNQRPPNEPRPKWE